MTKYSCAYFLKNEADGLGTRYGAFTFNLSFMKKENINIDFCGKAARGDLRIIYSGDDDIIIVKDVLPRGQAYKRL